MAPLWQFIYIVILLQALSICVVHSSSFTGWTDYLGQWRSREPVKSSRMYPYGTYFLDVEASGEQRREGFDPIIDFTYNFMGVSYPSVYVARTRGRGTAARVVCATRATVPRSRVLATSGFNGIYIKISIHGHIALSSTIPATPVDAWSGDWPNPFYPENNIQDPPFIAPFYSKTDMAVSDVFEPSRIYYRLIQKTTSLELAERIGNDQLEYISDEIRQATIGHDMFSATHGIIVTWDKMKFSGSQCDTTEVQDTCPRNTFQVALVTDGVSSHVVINYFNLTWVGGSDQKCDPRTGKASDNFPECRAAQNARPASTTTLVRYRPDAGEVGSMSIGCQSELLCYLGDITPTFQAGFNAGLARGFTPLPHSLTSNILQLISDGGPLASGRYFFEVATTKILRGGCSNTNDAVMGRMWGLQVSPAWDGMFGGQEVNVSGPCFVNKDAIKCKFGDHVTSGLSLYSVMRASCTVPSQTKLGTGVLEVSLDGGVNYHYSTQFTTGHVAHMARRVEVSATNDDWLNPEHIQVGWLSKSLTWESGVEVEILLRGYTENAEGKGEWTELHTLVASIVNGGHYIIQPGDHQCGGSDVTRCREFDVGAIEVRLKEREQSHTDMSILSDLIPLGWFIKSAMTDLYGEDWADINCQRWALSDKKQTGWLSDIWLCPCTLQQALADFGRFQPDAYCNMFDETTREQCRRHQDAVHCVLSVWATSSGAGSQCCYDLRGDLIYSGDTIEGSTPDKSHPWGSPPYGVAPRVPSLSHAISDVTPYFYCCEYQDNDYDCFNLFISSRLTPSCKNYQASGHAATFGDPHFRTFDGSVYTFNGAGEFWFIKTDEVTKDGQSVRYEVQGRLVPVPLTVRNAPVRASMVSSIAMREVGKSTVEARLSADREAEKIELFVDKQRVFFPDDETRIQFFRDVILINHDAAGSGLRTNFTVVFRSGLGMQVSHKAGVMHAIVSLPPEFKEHTMGLFGDWNGGSDDDLRPNGGGGTVPTDDLERIHNSFGWTWAVAETASLFMYVSKLTHTYYQNQSFIPSFIYPSGGVYPVCDGNQQCAYDYVIMDSQDVARDTRVIQSWLNELNTMAQPVATCGWLNVRNSVKKAPISYAAGSSVTITGCRHGFELEGPTVYTCVPYGDGNYQWSPAVTTVCKDLSGAKILETKMAIAISIPAGIIFLLLLIAIIACCCCCRKRRQKKKLMEKERNVADEPANDEFFSDFHDVKTTPSRPPRPAYRSPQVPNLSSATESSHPMNGNRNYSGEDLTLDDSFRRSESADQPDHAMAVKYKVFPDECLDLTQTGKKPRRPPYQYPRNPETFEEKKRPPYKYPKSNTGLTEEERAIIELRARDYSMSDSNV